MKINNSLKKTFFIKTRNVWQNKSMKIIILLYLIVLSKSENEFPYENYKLYKIVPLTEEHAQLLQNIEETHKNFMFWKYPGHVNNSVDLMVPLDQDEDFVKFMRINSLQYKLVSQDIQKLWDEDEGRKKHYWKPTTPQSRKPFGFRDFHPWENFVEWFEKLRSQFPRKIRIICMGETWRGNRIVGVRLSFGRIRKPGVFIEGGMHGCEKISSSTVAFILNQFLYPKNQATKFLAEKYDWYFFPVINIDGYIYSTLKWPWRKTMSVQEARKIFGVDPNRNFGYRWFQYDGSDDPNSEKFSGSKAFSEIETRSLARFVKMISHKLFAYISFHSYGKVLTFPYGHTTDPLDNYEELLAIGNKTIAAIQRRRGTIFRTGNVASVLHSMTATSTDWVKAALKLPIVFTYVLDDTETYQIRPSQIIPIGEEVVDSFIALFGEAEKYGYPKLMN